LQAVPDLFELTPEHRAPPGTAAKRPGQRLDAPTASRFGDTCARSTVALTLRDKVRNAGDAAAVRGHPLPRRYAVAFRNDFNVVPGHHTHSTISASHGLCCGCGWFTGTRIVEARSSA
jgi:hypothetical protein